MRCWAVAIKDYTANVEPDVRPLLRSGERLLAASPLIPDPGTTEDVSVADDLRNLLDPTILLGGSHPGNILAQAAFGRAVTGASGSMARQVFDAAGRVRAPHLAVTDQRLLIYTMRVEAGGVGIWQRWFGRPVVQVAEAHAVPRDAIVGAVAAGKGVLRRGRLLIGFVDGSGCVLVCTPPSLATPVIAAVGPPRAGDELRSDTEERR